MYGLVAYGVAQRTREFGIRTALGASAGELLAMVLREGAILIAAGLALGLAGSFAVTQLLSSIVTGAPVHDPLVFTLVPVVLAAVAALACLVPALRASRIDPIIALRAE